MDLALNNLQRLIYHKTNQPIETIRWRGSSQWSSGEYGVPLRFHYSLVHSDLEWSYLLGSNLRVIQNCLTECKQMADYKFNN